MASSHDKNGRPIVVVTGMGVITSLGAGKADNWAKLTAGESGIHRITRFANEGLKTTIAGSVDFIPVEPFCSTDLGERMAAMVAEEAIAEAGIGTQGRFPGPAVPGRRAGGDRVAASRRAGGRVRRQRRGRIRRPPARQRLGPLPRHPRALPVRLGRRASRRPVRHQGLAHFAVHRLCLGRERDPARRRGDPPRRSRGRALHRHRRLGQSGGIDPLLAVVRALDLEQSAGVGGKAVCQEPRRLRHGRRRRRARARELRIPPSRAARTSSAFSPAAARWRTRSTAPARAPTASRSSAASAAPSRMPASRPTTSTTSTRMAPARPRTTRWNISAWRRCSESGPNRFRSPRTSR